MRVESPAPAAIIAARESVQAHLGIGITAAQDWCAEQVHVARRTWQSWERGEREMPPAHWELAAIKIGASKKNGATSPPRRSMEPR